VLYAFESLLKILKNLHKCKIENHKIFFLSLCRVIEELKSKVLEGFQEIFIPFVYGVAHQIRRCSSCWLSIFLFSLKTENFFFLCEKHFVERKYIKIFFAWYYWCCPFVVENEGWFCRDRKLSCAFLASSWLLYRVWFVDSLVHCIWEKNVDKFLFFILLRGRSKRNEE
jgi:hypothetical protein